MNKIEEQIIDGLVNLIESSGYYIGRIQSDNPPHAQLLIRGHTEVIKKARAMLKDMFVQTQAVKK